MPHKLTIEVDLDLEHDQLGASEIIGNLIEQLEIIENEAAGGKLSGYAAGLVLNPLDDDALVGNWRIDVTR